MWDHKKVEALIAKENKYMNKLKQNLTRIEKKNEKEKKVFESNSNILSENTYPSIENINKRIHEKKEVLNILLFRIWKKIDIIYMKK